MSVLGQKAIAVSGRLVVRGLVFVGALALVAALAVTAAAQQTPVRVVQGTDGAFYLVQGQNAWTMNPDQIGDADVGALNLIGQIAGALPVQTGPLRVAQGGDGSLYLIQGNNAWTLVPDQISDDALAAFNPSGEINGVIPNEFLSTPPPQAAPPATPATPASQPAAPPAAPPCAVAHVVASSGTAVSTVITGVPTGPLNIPPLYHACDGVFGIAFDPFDNIYLASQVTGDVLKFGHAGGNATSSPPIGRPLGPTGYDLTFNSKGELYGVRPLTNGDWTAGVVLQIDPQTGSIVRTVAGSMTLPTWIATDPVNGDLFVTNGGAGYLLATNLWRIHDPAGGTTVSIFATDPSGFTQLAFAPNGTLYALARDGKVLTFNGTDSSASATGTTLTRVTPNSVGLALGPVGSDGRPSALYFAVPDSISRVDLQGGSITEVVTGGGGAIFDLKVGHDHCLYANAFADVIKVTNADGSCNLTPAAE